jgi:ribosome-associated translation inhibitor RaiA
MGQCGESATGTVRSNTREASATAREYGGSFWHPRCSNHGVTASGGDPQRWNEEPMPIEISGIAIDRALRARVTSQLTHALRTVHQGPVVSSVTFFDDNGPKGGRDIRCTCTVRVPRRRAIHVEHVGETPRVAFDIAMEALARRLQELSERGRTLRRRPKKYFVAKQLMTRETKT